MAYAAAVLFLLALLFYAARKSGKDAEGLSQEKRKNAAVTKANVVRHRLKSDSRFAKRVRKRFTR